MTRQLVIVNLSNYEDEDYEIYFSRDGKELQPKTIIAPGERAYVPCYPIDEVNVIVIPRKNMDKETKHVDHAGWEVEVKGKPRNAQLE